MVSTNLSQSVLGEEFFAVRISTTSPFAIDLNLGCPAPNIKKRTAGAALFNDNERLNRTLNTLRKNWDGIFTVKCRLGHESKNWKQDFKEKLTLFENNGIDAIIVHPRFSEDKLKRRARWEHFSWIAEHTTLPIIGNGDILSPDQLKDNKELFSPLSGLMLGRITAVKPWIFKDFYNALCSDTSEPTHVNYPKYRIILSRSGQTILNMPCHLTHYYTDVWETFYKYTLEDFPPEKAIGRIKEFSTYYARNFFFGHELYSAVQGAKSLEEIFKSAMAFLDNNPKVSGSVSVAGI